ncbi:MAG: outer membrane beta-barrel protein [Myxococcota bacterium]
MQSTSTKNLWSARVIVAALLSAPMSASAFTLTTTVADSPLSLSVDGFVGAYYSYVVQNPDNGISVARLFSSRHNTIAISGASIGFELRYADAFIYIAPWFGLTPATIYSGEPTAVVAGGVGPSNAAVWRNLRAAYGGFDTGPWTFDAGLFVSPIGFEGVAAKDNWLWSSSWQNYLLPFYHFGARAHYDLANGNTLGFWVVNGFAGAVDANEAKSIIVTASGGVGEGQWQVLYYGGAERPDGAERDLSWLHMLDAWISIPLSDRVEVAGQFDIGIEPSEFGLSYFLAASGYVRLALTDIVSLAARAEVFTENAADNEQGSAGPFFLPADWVVAGSVALEVRPVEHSAIRLEYRHDQAERELFFDGDGAGKSQDAFTLGLTVWL